MYECNIGSSCCKVACILCVWITQFRAFSLLPPHWSASLGNIQRTLLIFLMHFSDFHGGAAMIYMTTRRRCEPRASSAGPLRHFHGPLPVTITPAEKNLGACNELKMNRHGVADVVSPWSVVPAPSPIQMPRVTATACLAAGYLAALPSVDVRQARHCKASLEIKTKWRWIDK